MSKAKSSRPKVSRTWLAEKLRKMLEPEDDTAPTQRANLLTLAADWLECIELKNLERFLDDGDDGRTLASRTITLDELDNVNACVGDGVFARVNGDDVECEGEPGLLGLLIALDDELAPDSGEGG